MRQFKKSHIVQAIQFQSADSSHVQDIIDFVGLPISIDYKNEGVILRVIRGSLDVIVAEVSDYIVMHQDGELERIKETDFDYEEVTTS